MSRIVAERLRAAATSGAVNDRPVTKQNMLEAADEIDRLWTVVDAYNNKITELWRSLQDLRGRDL